MLQCWLTIISQAFTAHIKRVTLMDEAAKPSVWSVSTVTFLHNYCTQQCRETALTVILQYVVTVQRIRTLIVLKDTWEMGVLCSWNNYSKSYAFLEFHYLHIKYHPKRVTHVGWQKYEIQLHALMFKKQNYFFHAVCRNIPVITFLFFIFLKRFV